MVGLVIDGQVSYWGAKVTGGAACKIPVEVLLSDTVFEAIEAGGTDQVFLLSLGEEVSKGEESAHGPEEVGVFAVKLKDRFGSKVVEAPSGEVKSSDPAAMLFEEKGRVEVVELDLTKFVHQQNVISLENSLNCLYFA